MIVRSLMFLLLLISMVKPSLAQDVQTFTQQTWTQVAPGGGGRLLAPAMMPNSDVLFCGSDMGIAYRSSNAGQNWQVIPSQIFPAILTSTWTGRGSWTFAPNNPSLMWAGTPGGFMRSINAGKTWQHITGPWDNVRAISWRLPSRGPHMITHSNFRDDVLLAGFNAFQVSNQRRLFISHDNGRNWRSLDQLKLAKDESFITAMFDDAHGKQNLLLVTNLKVYRSTDDGKNWYTLNINWPTQNDIPLLILDANHGYDQASNLQVYVIIKRTQTGKKAGDHGILRSKDGGQSWESITGKGLGQCQSNNSSSIYRHLAVCTAKPNRLYVSINPTRKSDDQIVGVTVLRSDDAGDSFRPILFQTPEHDLFNVEGDSWTQYQWGLHAKLSGVSVDPVNPDRVMCTNFTSCYYSDNGGADWQTVHAKTLVNGKTPGGGMPVMSAWNYKINPSDANHHFIPMTDFGGWDSHDAGQSWQRQSQGNPWHNNIYNVAFDTQNPLRVWAASSSTHDIPFFSYRTRMFKSRGGIVRSDDGGQTWQPVGQKTGLPNTAMLDVMTVSDAKKQTQIFAAAVGHGVFTSVDDGKTWQQSNEGISQNNRAVIRLGQDQTGLCYALSTVDVRKKNDRAGSLYVSRDQGQHWEKLFHRNDAAYLLNFAIDPSNSQNLILAEMESHQDSGDGGLWISHDGGKQWEQSLTGAYWAAAFSPTISGRIYGANFGKGLIISDDAGQTWRQDSSFPVWRPTNFTFQNGQMFVTAFGGGVWRANEINLSQHQAMNLNPTPSTDTQFSYPTWQLNNDKISVILYQPDSQQGYYRASRFDHASMIQSAKTSNHTYFGNFLSKHDAYQHDGASGPAIEFSSTSPPGYGQAQDGKLSRTFLKIGVGHLGRVNNKSYNFRQNYPLVEAGQWELLDHQADQLAIRHILPTLNGYGYQYTKQFKLAKDQASLQIQHTLRNIGKKPIITNMYVHQFAIIDHQTIGPDYVVRFGFKPKYSETSRYARFVDLKDRDLTFTQPLGRTNETSPYLPLLDIASLDLSEHSYLVGYKPAGIGMQIKHHWSTDKITFWASERAICPEPYMDINLQTAEQCTWVDEYIFDVPIILDQRITELP